MTNTQRRLLAAALLSGMAFLSIIFALQGSLLTSIISHFSLSDSAQGFSSSVAYLGGIVALTSAFVLIGRLPKLLMLRLAIGLCSVFMVLLAFAPSFEVFVAVWFIVGIGMGFIDTLLSSCVADLYQGRAATRMLCMLHTCYGLASVISPLLFSSLLESGMQWNYLYILVAAVGLALLAYTSVVVRNARSEGRIAAEARLSAGGMLALLKKGTLLPLIAAMFFHGLYLSGLNTWIIRYVGVTLGSALGSMAMSSLFLGIMLARILTPMLPVSPAKLVPVAGVISGAVILLALPFRNGAVMCAAACISGLTCGATIPCLLSIGCEATPESTLFATTALMLAYYVGECIVSPIIGAMEASMTLHAGIALCGVCMVLSGLLAMLNRRIRNPA